MCYYLAFFFLVYLRFLRVGFVVVVGVAVSDASSNGGSSMAEFLL